MTPRTSPVLGLTTRQWWREQHRCGRILSRHLAEVLNISIEADVLYGAEDSAEKQEFVAQETAAARARLSFRLKEALTHA